MLFCAPRGVGPCFCVLMIWWHGVLVVYVVHAAGVGVGWGGDVWFNPRSPNSPSPWQRLNFIQFITHAFPRGGGGNLLGFKQMEKKSYGILRKTIAEDTFLHHTLEMRLSIAASEVFSLENHRISRLTHTQVSQTWTFDVIFKLFIIYLISCWRVSLCLA